MNLQKKPFEEKCSEKSIKLSVLNSPYNATYDRRFSALSRSENDPFEAVVKFIAENA